MNKFRQDNEHDHANEQERGFDAGAGTRSGQERRRSFARRLIGGVSAVVLLGILPILSHLKWHRPEPALHGVPAFFLGLTVWVLSWGAVGCLGGLRDQGLRWLGSRGALRRGLATLVLLVSVGVLFYSVEGWRGKRAWARVAEEARGRGVSLDSREPVPAAVPETQDFGQAPLFAPLWKAEAQPPPLGSEPDENGDLGILHRLGNRLFGASWRSQPGWILGRTQDLAGWARVFRPPAPTHRFKMRQVDGQVRGGFEKTPVPDGESTPIEILRRALAEYAPLLEGVRDAAARPACRLPFAHDSAMLSGDPSERVLLGVQFLAGLSAEVAVAEGRGKDAYRDLELGLRVAGHIRSLPGLYTRAVRAQALAQGLQPLWEGLRRGFWSEAEIGGIQRLLEGYRPIDDREGHRRVVVLAVIDFVEGVVPTGRAEPVGWSGLSEDDRRVLGWVRRFYPTGWSALSQAATVGAWLHAAAGGEGAGTRGPSARVEVLRGTSDPFFPVFVAPKLAQMWEDGQQGCLRGEALARIAEVACALERHRLAQGEVPAALAELVPRYLPRVPADPVDRAPLRYRRDGPDAFVVYSVGPDGRDDAGKQVVTETPAEGPGGADASGDWVWRRGGTGTSFEL